MKTSVKHFGLAVVP